MYGRSDPGHLTVTCARVRSAACSQAWMPSACRPACACCMPTHPPCTRVHSSMRACHAQVGCAWYAQSIRMQYMHAIYACNMHAMGTSASRLSAIHPFVQAWKAEASSGARSRLAACVPEASHRARQGAEPAAASGAHGQVTCRRRSIAYTLASHRSVQHDHAQETSR